MSMWTRESGKIRKPQQSTEAAAKTVANRAKDTVRDSDPGYESESEPIAANFFFCHLYYKMVAIVTNQELPKM
jgi:hypothetical protein